jgi:hypothetical protein
MLFARYAFQIFGIGVAYAISLWATQLFARPSSEIGIRSSLATFDWKHALIAGWLLGVAVRLIVSRLDLAPSGVVIAILVFVFVFGFVLTMIEAAIFTEESTPIRPSEAIGALICSGVVATLAGLGMKPYRSAQSAMLADNFEQYVETTGVGAVVLDIALASVAFMVVYNIVGTATWRFLRSNYADPSEGMGMRVLTTRNNLLVQLGRGLLATVALMPILLSTTVRGLNSWALVFMAVAITAGIVPGLSAVRWPRPLRVAHGIEVTVFASIQAIAWSVLFR